MLPYARKSAPRFDVRAALSAAFAMCIWAALVLWLGVIIGMTLPFRSAHAAEQCIASWYSVRSSGSTTASGERLHDNALTAAHKRLRFGTHVRVTNLRNGRSVVVRINDRGPFVKARCIDLTRAGRRVLGMDGLAPVRLDVVR